jgi:hypothetical protein
MISNIKESWGWIGIDPVEIIDQNEFGNLIIKDTDGRFWRLCPEELSCEIVAANPEELSTLLEDREFLRDWNMQALVDYAKEKLGPLQDGRKYCLKIPGILGGEYGGDNLGTISLLEMIDFSGDLANQIKDLPDGAKIEFDLTD